GRAASRAAGGCPPPHRAEAVHRLGGRLDETHGVVGARLPFLFRRGGGRQEERRRRAGTLLVALSGLLSLRKTRHRRPNPRAPRNHDLPPGFPVLFNIGGCLPPDAQFGGQLLGAFRRRFASHPPLRGVRAKTSWEKPPVLPAPAGKIRRWLSFLPGQVLYMPGR